MTATVTGGDINVRQWAFTHMGSDGDHVKLVYGKLVLAENHTMVLDPDTREVKFAVPNENLSKVEAT